MPEEGDDAVIGRALRNSVTIMLAAALFGVALWLLLTRPEQIAPVEEAAVAGPQAAGKTTGGIPPDVRFTDITAEAGIEFIHVNGAYGDRLLPETMGSGLAFLDFDNDGDQDLLLVNSTHWPWRAESHSPTSALYRNRGDGTFENVTSASGLDRSLYGTGVAVGDYDGDGFVDVFISALGPNRLFRNIEGRTFEEVTDAGVAGDRQAWSTSAGFFDYDLDGDLDLFVANYVKWSRQIDFDVDYRLTGIGRAYGPPTNFEGTQSYLYRNEGGGRFTDVSTLVRVENPASRAAVGKALGVLPTDVDADGRLDIVVANDTVRNFLFRQMPSGEFEETGVPLGVAFDNSGSATGAMGIDGAHHNNDGDFAISVGNFANEMTSFYVAQGGSGQFTDEAIVSGIGPQSRQALSFGLFFFDYDLDGRLDLLQANGHVEPDINQVQPSQHYAQPSQLFWNCGLACERIFLPVTDAGDLARPLVGRGASYADIDADGDLDVAITQAGGSPLLLRNDQRTGHRWLRVRLVGKPPNRGAIGARVELRAGGDSQYRLVMPTRSYLSQVELPVTFGLGDRTRADSLKIVWPDGAVQIIESPPLDRELVVEQA